jgi:hypothetical protein
MADLLNRADIWLDCHIRHRHTPRVIDGAVRCKFCGTDCGW